MRLGRHIKATRRWSRFPVFGSFAILCFLVSPVSLLAEDSAAADALNGVAAAIKGAEPAVDAAIQASADVGIATTNAAASDKMTQISADTSKYLADRQTEVALYQDRTAQEMDYINQFWQTRRLDDQLAELRAASKDALQAELQKLAYEKQLDDEKIELARRQAADNFKLAQATLNASLTQAGNLSGFTTFNSGLRLKVSPAFPSRRLASAGSAFGERSRRLLSSGMGNSVWGSQTNTPVGAQMASNLASGSYPGHHQRAISSVPQSDLASFHAAVQTVERGPAALAPEEALRSSGGRRHHGEGVTSNQVSTHAGSSPEGAEAIQVRSLRR